jgi:type II secretory pathway pseudopilin PulG
MANPADDQRQDYDDFAWPGTPNGEPPATRRPRKGFHPAEIVVVVLICGILVALLLPAMSHVGDASYRVNSSNNLKVIGLAMHNFNDQYGELPNNTYSDDGKPLLSWRVHILPYVEEEKLYSQFRLDEPWDSPNNLPLLDRMPRVYANPKDKIGERGNKTYYRGFSNAGAVFERRPTMPYWRLQFFGPVGVPPRLLDKRKPRFDRASIKDGLANTILIVEAGEAVEWTKPDDLDASPNNPFPPVGGFKIRGNVFGVLLGDGSYRHWPLDYPQDKLRALITHSGGEMVTPD